LTKDVIPISRTDPALDLTVLFNGFRPLFHALSPNEVNAFALEIVKTLQGEGGVIADLAAKSASLTNTVADRDAVIGGVDRQPDVGPRHRRATQRRPQPDDRAVAAVDHRPRQRPQHDRGLAAHIDNLASNSASLLARDPAVTCRATSPASAGRQLAQHDAQLSGL